MNPSINKVINSESDYRPMSRRRTRDQQVECLIPTAALATLWASCSHVCPTLLQLRPYSAMETCLIYYYF